MESHESTCAGTLTRSGTDVPAAPWRDPRSVSPRDLSQYIQHLQRLVVERPRAPELWTMLAMAHAVNYDVNQSMQALERAAEVAPTYFWGRLKYGELLYRLRALDAAEAQTLQAMALAADPFQLSVARKQLVEIRALNPRRVRRDAPMSKRGLAIYIALLLLCAIVVAITA